MTREQEALTVQRVLDGNADEYEKLVLEYQKNVYNLALRLTGDPEDAADMAQEAFIKAYSSLSGYRGESKFSVWLYRIVSNVCLDFLRAKKRRQTVSLSVTDDDGEDTELDIADESKSPERIFERAMTRDAVRRGLAALTPEYRQILILRELQGMSYEEIAEVLGKETIDSYNQSENRGAQTSHGLNYQKLGKELMSQDEIATMDGGKCILQVRGVRPFFSEKYDITRHPRYKYLSDADKKNTFDVDSYLSSLRRKRRRVITEDEPFDLYDIELSEEDFSAE